MVNDSSLASKEDIVAQCDVTSEEASEVTEKQINFMGKGDAFTSFRT